MDTNIEEVYAVFGELIAVQGVTMKRQQRQIAELDEKLAAVQARIRELEAVNEGKDGGQGT